MEKVLACPSSCKPCHSFGMELALGKYTPLKKNKNKNQTQNGVTCGKPHQYLIPYLTAVSAYPRGGILHQPVYNFLVSTGDVICQLRPLTFS